MKEVHVVFDNPGSQEETPRELEKARRDNAAEIQIPITACLSAVSFLYQISGEAYSHVESVRRI